MVEPFLTVAAKSGAARVLATGDDAIGPKFTSTCWSATSQWAKAHPDLVERFVNPMMESARWANANRAKVVPLLANRHPRIGLILSNG